MILLTQNQLCFGVIYNFYFRKDYPNIYNKMLKNEINLKVLYEFLDELEKIEKGKQNQHEASFKIGTLLKEIYIDKKLNLTKENEPIQKKKITYEEFKKQQENMFKDK